MRIPLLLLVIMTGCDEARTDESKAAPDRPANRLIHEKSVYLRQHAYNPVDWFPWGDEAFEKARTEDKPIFLSIGYSTCHWCHVMERESFEDEETAAYLNEHFVSIKVDREERPDVDSIYMTYVQAQTGSGGWPLNSVLTPDRVPFFGGTYFPPRRMQGRLSFREVLARVIEVWTDQREQIEAGSDAVEKFLRARADVPREPGTLDVSVLDAAFAAYETRFDPVYGGTTGRMKFPAPRTLQLLLRHEHRTGAKRALEMAVTTFDKMWEGGMYDHLGGGFSRYTVDALWLVPHFEKMLYDNAQLARAYAEGFLRTGEPRFEAITRGILDYLLRDMRLEGGAFAAAEDADSEGEEGLFYTWTQDEVRAVLGDELGGKAIAYYGVTERGHVEGRSVLHVADPAQLAGEELETARERLFDDRAKRVRPLRDDKVLSDWNGLAISAFAFAGRALDEPRYLDAAREAATFLLEHLDLPVDPEDADGERRLMRRWREGEARVAGHLSDHAFLAQGLLDLYESDFDVRWLDASLDLTRRAMRDFLDPETGTFFDVAAGNDDLLVRTRDASDRAVPSGTAVMVKNLLRLGELSMDDDLRSAGTRCLDVYVSQMEQAGLGFVELVNAAGMALEPPREVVFAGRRGSDDLEALVTSYWSKFRPYRVLAHAPADASARDALAARFELLAGKEPRGGAAAAYVCENYACQAPVTDPAALE